MRSPAFGVTNLALALILVSGCSFLKGGEDDSEDKVASSGADLSWDEAPPAAAPASSVEAIPFDAAPVGPKPQSAGAQVARGGNLSSDVFSSGPPGQSPLDSDRFGFEDDLKPAREPSPGGPSPIVGAPLGAPPRDPAPTRPNPPARDEPVEVAPPRSEPSWDDAPPLETPPAPSPRLNLGATSPPTTLGSGLGLQLGARPPADIVPSRGADGFPGTGARAPGPTFGTRPPSPAPSRTEPPKVAPKPYPAPPTSRVEPVPVAPSGLPDRPSPSFGKPDLGPDPMAVSIHSPPREKEPAPSPVEVSPPTPLPDPETLRAQGVGEYKARNFKAAVKTFRRYLGAGYPDDDQRIQWRLSQALFEDGRWAEASTEFRKLVGSPDPDMRADAMMRLGMIDRKKGDFESAKTRWNRVIQNYGDTQAAKRAAAMLQEETP